MTSDPSDALNKRIDELVKILEQVLSNSSDYGQPSTSLVTCLDLDPDKGYFVEEIVEIVKKYVQEQNIKTFLHMFDKNDAGFYPDNHLLTVFKPNKYYRGIPAMTWDKVYTDIWANLSKHPDTLSKPEQLKSIRMLLR